MSVSRNITKLAALTKMKQNQQNIPGFGLLEAS